MALDGGRRSTRRGPGGRAWRVLIIVENLPVPLDRRVWMEATTLAVAGVDVTVISPKGGGFDETYEEREGVRIYRHALPVEGSGVFGYLVEYTTALAAQLRLAFRVLRRHGVDVVQGCNPPDLIFLVAWALRPFGVRYVFDHHDVGPELYEAKFGRRGPFWRLMRLLEWATFRTALVSIATNESFAEIARDRGGMPPKDVFVVRSAPRVDQFKSISASSGAGGGLRQIGYVGVIGPQDGLDLLVAAADHLVHELGRTNVRFAIVGFGTELPAVEAEARRRGLQDVFTFHGPKYGDELLSILSESDICVSPDPKNLMNDISTMNKVVEYMALAKPVVLFDLKEGRASAGDAALYATPNDPRNFAEKIAWLLDRPEERARLGAAGRRRFVERLSWDASAEVLLRAYDRVFEKIEGDRTRSIV